MLSSPKVLIGTLYSGENEFDQQKKSLEEQTYERWSHLVYRNLPNKEAHSRLYKSFMDKQRKFDLFIKLDGDMVFRSKKSIRKIINIFAESQNLDHLILAVNDWYSDSLITGLHIFSSNVTWTEIGDNRFVDPNPVIGGEKMKLWKEPAPVVDHSPNPSPLQAFRFGVHRSLKVLQSSRYLMRTGQSRGQWRILKKCWNRFKSEGDRRLGLACLGAHLVIKDEIDPSSYDGQDNSLEEKFEPFRSFTSSDIKSYLKNKWNDNIKMEHTYFKKNGILRLMLSKVYSLYSNDS